MPLEDLFYIYPFPDFAPKISDNSSGKEEKKGLKNELDIKVESSTKGRIHTEEVPLVTEHFIIPISEEQDSNRTSPNTVYNSPMNVSYSENETENEILVEDIGISSLNFYHTVDEQEGTGKKDSKVSSTDISEDEEEGSLSLNRIKTKKTESFPAKKSKNKWNTQKMKRVMKRLSSMGGIRIWSRLKSKRIEEEFWIEVFLKQQDGNRHESLKSYWGRFTLWKNNPSIHESFFEWQSRYFPDIAKTINSGVIYFDDEMQQKASLIIKNGLCYLEGKPYCTENESTFLSGKGTAIYVIDLRRRIYVSSQHIDELHHSRLMGGRAILGAGTLKTDQNGSITFITNRSGHYKPTREQLYNTLFILRSQGVNLKEVRLIEKTKIAVLVFSSALEWLETKGECLPILCNSLQFNRKEGRIDTLKPSSSVAYKKNGLKSWVKYGVNASKTEFKDVISFKIKKNKEDVLIHREIRFNALAFANSSIQGLLSIEGCTLVRDQKGDITRIEVPSKEEELAIVQYLGGMDVDTSRINFFRTRSLDS